MFDIVSVWDLDSPTASSEGRCHSVWQSRNADTSNSNTDKEFVLFSTITLICKSMAWQLYCQATSSSHKNGCSDYVASNTKSLDTAIYILITQKSISNTCESHLKGQSQPLPCFCFHLGMMRLTKLLEITTKKYLITKRNSWANWKTIHGLVGNVLLKTEVLSMENKMVAAAFGRARKYGWDGPFNFDMR